MYSRSPERLPTLTAPKIISASSYYRPSVDKQKINLLTSPAKAIAQQTGPKNIKNYMHAHIKTTTIDLGANMAPPAVH
jgi:hypothetical protein